MASRTALLVIACLSAAGCALGGGRGGEPLPPAELAQDLFTDSGLVSTGGCTAIVGSFRDSGRVLPERVDAPPASLSATVFRVVLPSDRGYPRRAQQVELSLDPASSILLVRTWGDGAHREDRIAYRCEGDWMHLVEVQGRQPLADGATQHRIRVDRWLGRAQDGGLLVQVSTRGTFGYYLSRNLPLDSDGWFHFPPSATVPVHPPPE